MKSLFLFFTSILLSSALFAGNEEAIAYNDRIVAEQSKIGEAILTFSSNPNEYTLKQIKNQADQSVAVLNAMKVYDGNKAFLDAGKALFKFYGNITKNEYKKILELIHEKNKYTPEQITAKINSLTESISKKETVLDKKFKDTQVEFAGKYNFTLTKNQLEDKIKNMQDE